MTNKKLYVCQLEKEKQIALENALKEMGLQGEELQDALDSRLEDLEDTLDITPYI